MRNYIIIVTIIVLATVTLVLMVGQKKQGQEGGMYSPLPVETANPQETDNWMPSDAVTGEELQPAAKLSPAEVE